MNFQQALELHRAGRVEEAAGAYQHILAEDPNHAGALIHLGALRLQQDRVDDAEPLLQRATIAAPDSAQAHANLAAALQRQERLQQAIAEYEQALARDPALHDARFALAVCLQTAGLTGQALDCYDILLRAQPDHAEANYGLAMLLTQLGRNVEAMRQFRATIAADPEFAEAHYELGRLLLQGESARRAIGSFRKALEIDPDYIEARLALADALAAHGATQAAAEAYQAVLAVEADNAEAKNALAVLHRREQAAHHSDAEPMAPEQALQAQLATIDALRKDNQHQAALEAARRLAEQHPDSMECSRQLGLILAELGEVDEAVATFRHAWSLAPRRLDMAHHAVWLARVKPDDDIVPQLEASLREVASLPPIHQSALHFALSKAYTDLQQQERGFNHLLQANALLRSLIEYDEAGTLDFMTRIRRVFTADFLHARQDLGDPSTVPVFIVGMPSSGSSLVEQILASHSTVFGAGERRELADVMLVDMSAARFGGTAFPEMMWTQPEAAFRELGADYVGRVRRLAPNALRITDKMPGNFLLAGLIRVILPNARIIHVRRNPVDNCLSCFARLFAEPQSWAYDLAELGRFHRSYQRLMAHWRAVLPARALLEVDYETLVQDVETQARRIVAFCGLDWEPGCLEFYKTRRLVRTASLTQVRQPIYRSSVTRWRPDAALLKPLLDALEEA